MIRGIISRTNAIQACLTLKLLLGLPLRQGVRFPPLVRGFAIACAIGPSKDGDGARLYGAPAGPVQARVVGAGLQHPVARPERDGTAAPVAPRKPVGPWMSSSRIAAPRGRFTCLSTMRHRPPSVRGRCRTASRSRAKGAEDRGPGGAAKARSTAQAHAWRLQAAQSRCRSDRWRGPLMAQDPPRHRRDGGGSGNRPGDRFPDGDWRSGRTRSPPAMSAMSSR